MIEVPRYRVLETQGGILSSSIGGVLHRAGGWAFRRCKETSLVGGALFDYCG